MQNKKVEWKIASNLKNDLRRLKLCTIDILIFLFLNYILSCTWIFMIVHNKG